MYTEIMQQDFLNYLQALKRRYSMKLASRLTILSAVLMINTLPLVSAPALPPGAYQSSCTKCEISNKTLTCTCPIAGTQFRTSISIDACKGKGEIANCEGALYCSDSCG